MDSQERELTKGQGIATKKAQKLHGRIRIYEL